MFLGCFIVFRLIVINVKLGGSVLVYVCLKLVFWRLVFLYIDFLNVLFFLFILFVYVKLFFNILEYIDF